MPTYWYNVQTESLPEPGKEVLVSVNGVNYLATFDADQRIFRTVHGTPMTFSLNSGSIYWTDLQRTGTGG